ncbi:carbohydrate ABC transporter permease [Paenibacillus lycopersici]|uniref:Carbohydrate ABC transporter permease n=1 Tax=Paenibacillus lycopersici TaxID=2704462 RepID=A0A6C0G4H9_9BACL|nr:carbohydrate ABC transporter permease [Paenibacillus lycopersici]QHT62319.1 carbohydrate ABC transporter permease [Paenibacillus lycopersici]
MKTEASTISFYAIGYTILTVLSLICLLPFWLLVFGSFTAEDEILSQGFRLFPRHFSLEAYHAVFHNSGSIVQAYKITVGVTVIGAFFGLFLTAMAGYVLSRKDYAYRNLFSFLIYFTTLFSGGLIPWYILIVSYLHLKDNFFVLIIPSLIGAWNIILMKNFMKSIPESITESAKIDGAGDFTIFMRLILPLSTPGLATIGLFIALGYWNDWFTANLFITTESKFPLQYLLYKILAAAEFLSHGVVAQTTGANMHPPSETLKMAVSVVATGPIIFLYPFVQRYFVKGLTIGAVKG